MKIHVKILGVKDGDAIIITLQKEKKNLVMLIDSGEKNYADRVISELEKALVSLSKTAPDVIVCTHYDNDHINGMKEIIEHFISKKAKIGQVWLHKPVSSLDQLILETKDYKNRKINIVPSFDSFVLKENFKNAGILSEAEYIIEGIPQLKTLVDYINDEGIQIVEPFAGFKYLPEWPEIEVVGPTAAFFRQIFPAGITTVNFIRQEVDFNLLCETKSPKFDKLTPCQILDFEANKKGVSKTNMASIIICITVDGEKFLFTGDADIKSLESIKDYKEKLSQVYFLKIPHHASRNNLSSELIDIMSPKFAYVSGDKYVDAEVIGCLRAHKADTQVTTTLGKDLEFSFGK